MSGGKPAATTAVECLEVLDDKGRPTGQVIPRKEVHRLGLPHRAVHSWLFCPRTQELLLQRRAFCKESFPGLWDASSAGHIVAGDSSLATAVKEMEEELGLTFPESAFEYIFEDFADEVLKGGAYLNKEFSDVYLVTVPDPIEKSQMTLQESEVAEVKWMTWREYQQQLLERNTEFVPFKADGLYAQLFAVLESRERSSLS